MIKVLKTLNEISGINSLKIYLAYHEGQSPGFLRLPQIEPFLTTVLNNWQLSDKLIDQIPAVVAKDKNIKDALTKATVLGRQYARLFTLSRKD